MWYYSVMENVVNKKKTKKYVYVGPCRHCMARPQLADGASNMEGSSEYSE